MTLAARSDSHTRTAADLTKQPHTQPLYREPETDSSRIQMLR